jgi:hexosaminidase
MRQIILLLTIAVATVSASSQDVAIIPQPSSVTVTEGYFILNRNSTVYADSFFDNQVNFLRQELMRHKSLPIIRNDNKEDASIIFLRESVGDMLYGLEINQKKIVIKSSGSEGAFYAVVSLLQLVNSSAIQGNSFNIKALSITDKPLYQWRGLMLDESRHFFGKEYVMHLLDWMAYYKLNKFHWHLTDEPAWRIEIAKYPYLALVGGVGSYTNSNAPAQYYTQRDIAEIVNYASQRNIEVIPEIDMPGHATAANRAYPQYSGGGSEKHPEFTFHPAKESVYGYLTDVLREVNALFPSQMIHIGGDEVSYGNEKWSADADVKRLMKQHKMTALKDVEDYFMRRMADSLLKMNSKVLVWDEMAAAGLPADRSIIFWWRHDKPEQLRKALDSGHSTVLCPRLPFYFDFVQDDAHRVGRKWSGNKFNTIKDVYQFSADSLQLNTDQKKLILGCQANLWTETVNNTNRLEYLVFPRIAALSEAVWSDPSTRNYDDFITRIVPHLWVYQKNRIYFYNPIKPESLPEPPLIK